MTKKLATLLLIVSLLLLGCSSTTVFRSDPSGAKVYINGESVGKTPYTYSDTKIMFSNNTVRLEKKGYETFYTSFTRDEAVNVGAIIGGFFTLVPFLWAMEYNPTHNYELIPLKEETKKSK